MQAPPEVMGVCVARRRRMTTGSPWLCVGGPLEVRRVGSKYAI